MNTSVSAMSRVSCLVVQQCSRNVPGVAACSVTPGANRIPAGRSFSSASSTSTGYLFKVNGHRRFPAVQIVSSRGYTQAASTLTREQLHDLVYRLNEDERELLMNTLKQFESNKQKAQFEGEISAYFSSCLLAFKCLPPHCKSLPPTRTTPPGSDGLPLSHSM